MRVWSDCRCPSLLILLLLAASLAACGEEESSANNSVPDARAPDAQQDVVTQDAVTQDVVTQDVVTQDVANEDVQGADAQTVCDLGTKWPDKSVIDPDNPVFEDAAHTQQQVTDMFAAAKAGNTDAYRAYKAARDYSPYFECAFCNCGCQALGHVSAIDCFKDLHGFT